MYDLPAFPTERWGGSGTPRDPIWDAPSLFHQVNSGDRINYGAGIRIVDEPDPTAAQLGLDVDFLPRPWIFLSFISLIFLPGERNISQNFFQNFKISSPQDGVLGCVSHCRCVKHLRKTTGLYRTRCTSTAHTHILTLDRLKAALQGAKVWKS